LKKTKRNPGHRSSLSTPGNKIYHKLLHYRGTSLIRKRTTVHCIVIGLPRAAERAVSLSLSLSLSLSQSLSFSLSLSLCFSVSVSVSLSLALSVSRSLSLSHCLCLPLFLSFSLSLSHTQTDISCRTMRSSVTQRVPGSAGNASGQDARSCFALHWDFGQAYPAEY